MRFAVYTAQTVVSAIAIKVHITIDDNGLLPPQESSVSTGTRTTKDPRSAPQTPEAKTRLSRTAYDRHEHVTPKQPAKRIM